jgi:hypothetical protein
MKDLGPKVTQLSGREILVTDEDRAKAFWLIQKYTSVGYLRRMFSLYANFVAGYEDFARREAERVVFHRDSLTSFYDYQASLRDGIDLLERGYKTGYSPVFDGCFFSEALNGRRFEFGFENEEIGFRARAPHVGLYAWAEVAIHMSVKVRRTLRAQWAFPRILDPAFVTFPFPAPLPPAPAPQGAVVSTGKEIPKSGIWQPTTTPASSPQYLWAGLSAPRGTRPTERLDYPDDPGGYGDDSTPAYTDYEYAAEPAEWRLLWEDHRYEGGHIPDESEYLDPSTEPPPWPPLVPLP